MDTCIVLSRSRCGVWRSSPDPVVGGSGATKTRRGSLPRSLRVVTRSLPRLGAMDCRRSSCLVGVAVAQMPVLGVLGDERKPPRCKSRSDVGMIEIEVDGVAIRVDRGADATMIAAIVQALKASR